MTYPEFRTDVTKLLKNIEHGSERISAFVSNPFFTTKSPAEGTGLGLYVCHNLIQGIGGNIEVESEPGKGSTFRVILPDKD